MNVDRAVRGRFQHAGREKQSIRGDDHGVGARGAQALGHLAWAQAFWLEDLKVARLRESLHWTRLAAHAAAGGAIGLGQYQRDFVSPKQLGERALSECRGPRED